MIIDLGDRETQASLRSDLGHLRGRGLAALETIQQGIVEQSLRDLLGGMTIADTTPEQMMRAKLVLEGIKEGTANLVRFVADLIASPAAEPEPDEKLRATVGPGAITARP